MNSVFLSPNWNPAQFLANASISTNYSQTVLQFFATVALSAFAFGVSKVREDWLKHKFLLLNSLSQPPDEKLLRVRQLKTRSKLVGLCFVLVPTICFVVIMRSQYVPAVFTMALLAIIVAADHDAELESSAERLKEELKEEIVTITEKSDEDVRQYAEKLAQLQEKHTWAARVEAKLKVDGNHAPSVRAVIHHWEVPTLLLIGDASTPIFDVESPLFQTFVKYQRAMGSDPRLRRSNMKFVCDGPLRVLSKQFFHKTESQFGDRYRFFFGLVYTMVNIYASVAYTKFNAEAHSYFPARIRIGFAEPWIHVIGDEVHQMIETQQPSRAISRPLHLEIEDLSSWPSPQEPRRRWLNSYSDMVQGAYERADRAEHYIASVILATEGQRPGTRSKNTFNLSGPGLTNKIRTIVKYLGATDDEYKKTLLLELLPDSVGLDDTAIAKMRSLLNNTGSLSGVSENLILNYLFLRWLSLDGFSAISGNTGGSTDFLTAYNTEFSKWKSQFDQQGILRTFLLEEVLL